MFGEEITDDFNEQFDIVVSLNCFEHVKTMDATLFNIYKSLRPGGVLLSNFGPVFSCEVGSHFWYKDDCNFNNPGVIPPFAHLLLSLEEIVELLSKKYPNTSAQEILYAAYGIKKGCHNYVNELFYEDYDVYFMRTPFSQYQIKPFWTTQVSPRTYNILRTRFPQYRRFDVYAVEITAVK